MTKKMGTSRRLTLLSALAVTWHQPVIDARSKEVSVVAPSSMVESGAKLECAGRCTERDSVRAGFVAVTATMRILSKQKPNAVTYTSKIMPKQQGSSLVPPMALVACRGSCLTCSPTPASTAESHIPLHTTKLHRTQRTRCKTSLIHIYTSSQREAMHLALVRDTVASCGDMLH